MSKRKKEKKYFGCWFYREDNSEPVTILSLHNKYGDMFNFPYEQKFGERNKRGEFCPNNDSIVMDMFGMNSFGKQPHYGILYLNTPEKVIEYCNEQSKLTGFSFHYGGKIDGEIPSYWEGGNIKILTKNISGLELRRNLETFCEIRES
jgi:hypothetical protein